jgi:hypothetical protein
MDPLLLSSSGTIEELTKVGCSLWGSPRRRLRKAMQASIGQPLDDIEATFRSLIAECDLRLTTAATFLNSDSNQQRNIVMSAAWSELADDARLHNLSYIQASEGVKDPSEEARVVNIAPSA